MERFTTQFCDIIKQQICTTSAELNFDDFTDEGTYEIYEDVGNGKTRVYFLTVDKSASGNCVSQTRLHCGKMEYRRHTSEGVWTSWETVGGGGSEGTDGGYYTPSITQIDETTAQMSFTPSKENMPPVEAVELTLPVYALTDTDKVEIVNLVLEALPNGDEVSY